MDDGPIVSHSASLNPTFLLVIWCSLDYSQKNLNVSLNEWKDRHKEFEEHVLPLILREETYSRKNVGNLCNCQLRCVSYSSVSTSLFTELGRFWTGWFSWETVLRRKLWIHPENQEWMVCTNIRWFC